MKKVLAVGLLALVISPIINTSTPTFAATKERGTTWWSVEEMLDFYQEVEQEKITECDQDEACGMEFDYNLLERGPKYSALNNFLETQLWITAVNPTKETVKIFYFNDDMMLKRMGIEEKIHLQHLYMGWFDEWNAQIFNYNHDRFVSGEISGLHTMYDGSSSVDGLDWIPAWEEVELSVSGSDLKDNLSGIIDYAVFAEENKFNAQGTFNYSDCLNAPDYIEGTECKLMISGDQWATYLPSREAKEEGGEEKAEDAAITDLSDDAVSNGPIDAATTTDETTTDPNDSNPSAGPGLIDNSTTAIDTTNSPVQIEEVSQSREIVEPKSELITITEGNQSLSAFESNRKIGIKTPNTGKSMSVVKGEVSPMPWWLIMMELLGGILMLWWFIPVRAIKRQKKQKSPKKSPKSLDKKSQVR
ncbi:hypothetical protein IKF04_02880 [Candidatus Saccharibacteria bacterium]|nr:hypothetical protein [Candidatus Saccharibacteria bacterium]